MQAVRGAVVNAADAHPTWKIDRRFVHSVAKRAAGTLTAEWPDVLAARLARRQKRLVEVVKNRQPRRGVASAAPKLSPLKILWREFGLKARQARHDGDLIREAVCIEMLRRIAELQRSSQH